MWLRFCIALLIKFRFHMAIVLENTIQALHYVFNCRMQRIRSDASYMLRYAIFLLNEVFVNFTKQRILSTPNPKITVSNLDIEKATPTKIQAYYFITCNKLKNS